MKKTIWAVAMAAMCLLVASCGGQNGKGGKMNKNDKKIADELVGELPEGSATGYTGDDAADLAKLDATNYVAITKGVFGFDLAPQEGWNLKSAISPNKVNNVDVMYTIDGPIDEAAVKELLFNKVLEASKGQVNKVDIDWKTFKSAMGDKLDDFAAYKAAEYPMLYYKYGDKTVMATLDATSSEKQSTVSYNLCLVNL